MRDTEVGAGEKDVYLVTAVAGHHPATLDDFIGATTVIVHSAEGEQELTGVGGRNGPAVQFCERQPSSAAEDMPVWEIVAQGERGMTARLVLQD